MEDDIQNIECCLIGSLIASDKAFESVKNLRKEYFVLSVHAEIYASICRRYQNGDPVEAGLLSREFSNHPDLKHVGGGQYIIDCVDAAVCPVNAPYYAEEIIKAHCQRAIAANMQNCDGSPESIKEKIKLLTELAEIDSGKSNRRFKPYSWAELDRLPKRQSLIKGILERHGLSVVYGESNCGKTFLTIDIAMHIALGRLWLNKRVQQGKALYIAAEGGLGLSERLQAFSLHHTLKEAPPLYLIPCGINLCSEGADTQEIVREAKIIGNVEIIIIDTLARAMSGGNENSPDDMGAFVKNCDLIREQTGAHVLIVHHSGKDTTKGSRGHSSLRAAVDSEIEVIKDASGIVTAEIRKQRDGKTGDKFSFTLHPIHLGNDEDGDPITSCVLLPADAPAHPRQRLSPNQRRAVDILSNLIIERGKPCIPKKGMRTINVVRIDDFRVALKEGNISASDKPDSVYKAIQRTIEILNDKGITATWNDVIWRVGQDGQ